MSARLAPDSGFTLVEALVSLFVFSLIAAGSVLMLMQSVDTQTRVGEAQAALRELQTARALLSGDLAQYVGRQAREPQSMRPRFIGGDADTPLAFVRAAGEPDPEHGGRTSLALVEYDVVGETLVRRTRAQLDAAATMVMPERIVLNGVSDARFEFFDGLRWHDQWLVSGQGAPPPRAVALLFRSERYGEVRIEALVGLGA
jgi:type II secretion system protein J